MRIDILSLFPAMFAGPFGDSITKRAVANGILDIQYLLCPLGGVYAGAEGEDSVYDGRFTSP